ncbi:protein of unknown function [Methylorubrum extorquens]|uniref:Uncharacterized protein n=1 Tax=Methylorubrum extorquens TaxID=408 RepID=A0A2N9AXB0_METEX|nr:protein of unknown function [Methylorubrum extorquens]
MGRGSGRGEPAHRRGLRRRFLRGGDPGPMRGAGRRMSAFPVARLVGLASGLLRRAVIGRVPKLFDAAYYRERNPGVARSGLDPFLHYAWFGARRDRNPNADFDTAFYRRQSGRTRLDPPAPLRADRRGAGSRSEPRLQHQPLSRPLSRRGRGGGQPAPALPHRRSGGGARGGALADRARPPAGARRRGGGSPPHPAGGRGRALRPDAAARQPARPHGGFRAALLRRTLRRRRRIRRPARCVPRLRGGGAGLACPGDRHGRRPAPADADAAPRVRALLRLPLRRRPGAAPALC